MPAEYDLTAAARQDIRDIWRYTAEQWGETQADRYTGLLEARFQQIAAGSALSRTFSARYPQVLVTRCEQHDIFYLSPAEQRPCIIAVLHARMDLLARLRERWPT